MFTVVFLVSMAATVFAADLPAPEAGGEAPTSGSVGEIDLPDALDVSQGIEAAEADQAERERWLQSPEAVRQRKESRYAFAGLGAAEAKELLLDVFAKELATLNDDPARWLSDATILEQHGPTAATVSRDGERSLLDADLPLQATDEQGELRKLDLELEVKSGVFEPTNSLTELRIPENVDEPIAIGDDGLAVSGIGADQGRRAQRLGEMNLFYPAALGETADTDRLVSPTATGVEIFDLLRSVDSPQTFRFELDLPEGASLNPDDSGGATVTRGEEQIASIPFPHATDAQGTVIPVDLSVEGNVIALRIAHREADVAYPILLDPLINEDWYNYNWFNGHNLQALSNGAWHYDESHAWIESSTHCIYACWGVGRGLFVSMPAGAHWGQQYGHWVYSAPNSNSYLQNAWANPFVRNDHGCSKSSYPEPHDYVGMWYGGAWNKFQNNQAITYGYNNINAWGSSFIIGLATGNGSAAPCWRDLALGGAAIWLDDWQSPAVNSVSGIPSGWFGDAAPITVSANSTDAGLGIQFVTVTQSGKGIIDQDQVGCTGLAGNRCPTSRNSQFNFTANSLGEGLRTSLVAAQDPLGKGSSSYEMTTKVDRSSPEVILDGQLAQATDADKGEEAAGEEIEKLPLPVYNLEIEAKDGNPSGESKHKRSGVEAIEIYLDDGETPVQSWQQSCGGPNYSCPMTRSYQLELSKTVTTAGEHTLKVIGRDQVGNVRERNIEFEYFPATGIKDEYVMHYFPLPDGQADETEEEHPVRPELAVNVMNGNLVYRQQDIDVEGPAVDLEVERYYNSQLPDAENSEFGDGWTLAQTPELKPAEGPTPDEAGFLDASGALDEGIELPTEAGTEKFDPDLQATLTKKPGGGYELTDETGESATSVAFDQTGQTEALLTEGAAKVDYSYEGGELAEIEVIDPATSRFDPEEVEELEEAQPAASDDPTYVAAFGSNGSGDGQLKSPGDVAVDSQGNLWVVDKSNNRIQKFDSEGQYMAKFGSYGSGDGQFNRPTAIAIAANGDLLVTDAGNGRVQRFSAAGAFLSKFGAKGTGNGQFTGSGPEGVAIDAEGDIWISDTYAGRLQEFSASGEFLRVVGSKGSGEGQIGEPTGVDIDEAGNVWVADWQNNRVEVFDAEGQFLDQFGSAGTGDGQFNRPDALEIDGEGNVWVGDQNNGRIQRFDLAAQYQGQFGSKGSGEGQFSFAYPMGIAADDRGHLWIADVNNHRIQEWALPGAQELFTAHAESLGSAGAEEGQLAAPADVEIDPEGGLWVADKGNDRIQHFDPEGRFDFQFGTTGSGDGQLSAPSGVTLDPEGNVWVADTGNDRVQKFSPSGEYLSKFGASGSGNGQFDEPVGIVYAPGLPVGHIYVADRGNNRVQLFGKGGGYWGQAGTHGSGEKQLIEPSAITLGGPSGESPVTLLIADSGNHRVQRWTWNAELVSEFGTLGAGKGQLNRPEAVDVDEQGTVWVGDRVNDRVQAFDEDGESLGQFGSQGTGDEQLELTYPMGLAASMGEVWVTDTGNDRLQRWHGFLYTPGPEAPTVEGDDPKVDVEASAGLLTSIDGEEAGEHAYTHSGDNLIAHDGPQGETAYEYDEADRLSKVTLANGTWGEIAYYADNRVKSVTVSAEGGEAKKTNFEYQDEPTRRTTVLPSDTPHVTYDIGADGSVFKWWNSQEPPELDLAGTLYDNREDDGGLIAGDHWLEAQAYSPEGIDSIEVIANGTDLVDEKYCEQDLEQEGLECVNPPLVNEWIAETGSHAPGHLTLEVIATDRIGQSSSERFWVDIPETPPLAPGTPVPPKFSEIAKFREDYGLEVVFPVEDEIQLNERIFDLITAWWNPHTPMGEVARASYERWGVPLRPQDVAELEYREWYVEEIGRLVEQWGNDHRPTTYAGYSVDHKSGGIVELGFTENQPANLSAFVASVNPPASDRLETYATSPSQSIGALVEKEEALTSLLEGSPTLRALVTEFWVDGKQSAVTVGAIDVGQTTSLLQQAFGSLSGVSIIHQPSRSFPTSGRNRNAGRMLAGDRLVLKVSDAECTSGFGAFEKRDRRSTDKPFIAPFVLTAGHCFALDANIWRSPYIGFGGKSDWSFVGQVTRNPYNFGNGVVDAASIRIESGGLAPRKIYSREGARPRVGSPVVARRGQLLCFSGQETGGVRCGDVVGIRKVQFENENRPVGSLKIDAPNIPGDSGAPVWNPRTGAAVGILRGYDRQFTWVQPLLNTPNNRGDHYRGVFGTGQMGGLHVMTSR